MLKLGYEIAQSTVAKYMAKHPPGSGQTWETFVIMPSALARVPRRADAWFRLLFVLVNLRLKRRRLTGTLGAVLGGGLSVSVIANIDRITCLVEWQKWSNYRF